MLREWSASCIRQKCLTLIVSTYCCIHKAISAIHSSSFSELSAAPKMSSTDSRLFASKCWHLWDHNESPRVQLLLEISLHCICVRVLCMCVGVCVCAVTKRVVIVITVRQTVKSSHKTTKQFKCSTVRVIYIYVCVCMCACCIELISLARAVSWLPAHTINRQRRWGGRQLS